MQGDVKLLAEALNKSSHDVAYNVLTKLTDLVEEAVSVFVEG